MQGSLALHGIRSSAIGKRCGLGIIVSLSLVAQLAGCGQKGPLYLPEAPPAVAASPAASAAPSPAAVRP